MSDRHMLRRRQLRLDFQETADVSVPRTEFHADAIGNRRPVWRYGEIRCEMGRKIFDI